MDHPPRKLPVKALPALLARFDDMAGGLGAVQRRWPEVVGEQAARFTVPVKLEEGELRVRCVSSVWASELLAMSGHVLDRLRSVIGDQAPTRLRPYAGRVPAAPDPHEATPEEPIPVEVSGDALARAEATLGALPPGALRESIARAIAASAARIEADARPPR